MAASRRHSFTVFLTRPRLLRPDRPSAKRLGLFGLLITVFGACSDTMAPPMVPPPLPPPVGPFPNLLSELELGASGARLYAPTWRLWTNGSTKERRIFLQDGGSIDTQNRDVWTFPEGARFTKTFSYLTQSSPQTPVPVETRVILRDEGQWKTAVYQWRADGVDADRLSGDAPVPVSVTLPDGSDLEHLIPSSSNCQSCHGGSPAFILGYSELQLNSPLPGGSGTQLEDFGLLGFFSEPIPSDPAAVLAPDDLTRDIIGYTQGNCAHCHNATTASSGLDLTHTTFLQNTVNQTANRGDVLITPGNPGASALYQAFASGFMPLLGVQLGDDATRTLMSDWITTHNFGN